MVLEAFRAGVNDYISKPIDPEIVVARLQLQLQLKQAQDALHQSEERYALAAEGSNDGLWDWDLTVGALYCSERMKTMLGLPESALQSVSEWFELIHEEDVARVRNDLTSHLRAESDHFETELRMLYSGDGYRWMLCRGLAVRDGRGKAVRIAGSLTDITEGKVADALTGLPNRLLFVDRVQRCLEQSRRYPSRQFAVLYLDIDGFKMINDSYGHEVGDDFLIEIARRIETSVRNCESVVSRLGGDEFAILVDNLATADGACRVAERVIRALSAPIQVADRELFTRASIGISASSDRCDTAEELIREADVGMYFAKENVHVPYKFFEPEMMAETVARLEMGSELRSSLGRQEMQVHYQPIIDITTGTTAGFEALIRWTSGRLGRVSPSEFIPVAEDTGMIVELGGFVIRSACQFASTLNRLASEPLLMSVNVSPKQLVSEDLLGQISDTLTSTGLPRGCLRLEITETAVMRDPDTCIRLLSALKDEGVVIGLDDFGTGYSSLAYLHRLPLDMLKIDQSFVAEMFSSDENMAIIQTIIALASSLKMDAVAEGVETYEQFARLKELGCRYAQGFFFSEPVPEALAPALVQYDWGCEILKPATTTTQ